MVAESSIAQRLRAARLRPTVARIGVLQLVEAAAPDSLAAEELFRQLITKGVRVGAGSVYRVLQELHTAGLLVREWGSARKAFYRSRLGAADGGMVRLVCSDSGRCIHVHDEQLLAALAALAMQHKLDLDGCSLTIAVERSRPP